MAREKYDLEKAQEAGGGMYEMQMPDPDCDVCDGEGIREMTLCIGMTQVKRDTYCDCTIKGFKQRR